MGSCILLIIQPVEYNVVSLEDIFELSNTSTVIIRRRVRMMYFYPWDYPANLQNREVQTRKSEEWVNFQLL